MVNLQLRIRPNAQKTRVVSVMDDGTLKVDVAAPAEDQKANEELLKFLAEEFEVNRSNVSLLAGQTNRRKLVRITV